MCTLIPFYLGSGFSRSLFLALDISSYVFFSCSLGHDTVIVGYDNESILKIITCVHVLRIVRAVL
jgi:hypothetical protein